MFVSAGGFLVSAVIPSALALAEKIAGPAHYKFDELVEGIEQEQRRLGAGPYLVVLWQRVLDYDGLTDWLFLGDAFDDIAAASRHSDQLLDSLRIRQMTPPTTGDYKWQVDPTRLGHYLPKIEPRTPVQIQDEKTLALTGSPYNRMYFCARVLGPFPSPIVGNELFDAMTESRQEFWAFFLDVGEAHRAHRPRRIPLSS